MINRLQSKTVGRSRRLLVAACIFGCFFLATAVSAGERFRLFPEFPTPYGFSLEEYYDRFKALEQPLLVNGHRTMQLPVDFKILYDNAVEYCFVGPQPLITNHWVVQTSFHRRYILRMVTPFTVDGTWTNVVSYQQPSFHLLEWWDGPRFGFYPVSSFGATNWPKLVRSGGDLSVLGFVLKTNAPVDGFATYYRGAYGR